jgi:hypothetical protein
VYPGILRARFKLFRVETCLRLPVTSLSCYSLTSFAELTLQSLVHDNRKCTLPFFVVIVFESPLPAHPPSIVTFAMFANALRQQVRLALSRSLTSLPSRSTLIPRAALTLRVPVSTSSFSTSLARLNENPGNPPSNKIFVGNLPFAIEEGELKDIFAEFGDVVEVRLGASRPLRWHSIKANSSPCIIGRSPDGRLRGFAHVEFASTEQASNAMDAHRAAPLFASDRELRLDFNTPRAPREREAPPPSHKLHFSGFEGDRDQLRSAMGEFGDQCNDIFIGSSTVTTSRLTTSKG